MSDLVNALCIDVDDLSYSLHEAGYKVGNLVYRADYEMDELLKRFSEWGLKATFFVPGIFANQAPHLVKRIVDEGHELASHGYFHGPVYKYTKNQFLECVRTNKRILEDLSGVEVSIYKAPMWSLNANTLWAYDALLEAGYKVDHSALPVFKEALKLDPSRLEPFVYCDSLKVIPPTVYTLSAKKFLPIYGGFYNAYIPVGVQKHLFGKINAKGIPFNLFFHPFEFTPHKEHFKFYKYRSLYASFYGVHAGRYSFILPMLRKRFQFSTLSGAYSDY